eukprot:TRINITY_DN4326_c0_g1_i1.p1 TRINITY_DN4326_c0_g1~~TRINITY_DN4326_c0_g1_i1.p1  ORF type:complete len:447 (+),score=80.92 TRINITY_DN4326_c0_g1_i1:206-1546(+)
MNISFNRRASREIVETFSFTMQDQGGNRKFGYVKRFLGGNNIMPFCVVIVSKLSCFGLFEELIKIISLMRYPPYKDLEFLIDSIRDSQIPKSGQSLEISTSIKPLQIESPKARNGDNKKYIVTMPKDNELLLHHISYYHLLKKFSADNVIRIFKTMLSESRIIFVADDLPTLSSICNSVYSLVYPFCWQHIFIPILPNEYLGYCEAPMPFMVGVLRPAYNKILKMEVEEALVVDLTHGKFLRTCKTDLQLCEPYKSDLKRKIDLLKKNLQKSRRHDLALAGSFYHFFSEIFSDYDTFYSDEEFDFKSFGAKKSKEVRKFLVKFRESQMLEHFLESNRTKEEKSRFHFSKTIQFARKILPDKRRVREERISLTVSNISNIFEKKENEYSINDLIMSEKGPMELKINSIQIENEEDHNKNNSDGNTQSQNNIKRSIIIFNEKKPLGKI